MAVAGTLGFQPRRSRLTTALRRHVDIAIAVLMGGIVALLLVALPVSAALSSAMIAAFVIIALIDTRIALMTLILVRATIDIVSSVPLISTSGSSNFNSGAMVSLLIIGIGFAHIALRRIDIFKIPLVKPYAFFLLVAFLGLAQAIDRSLAEQEFLRQISVLIVFILVVDLMSSMRDRRRMVRVLVFSAVVPLGFGFYQLFTNTGNHETPGFNRILGTLAHPSPYGYYLVQLLPFAMVLAIYTKNRFARLGLMAIAPLMLFSIYATQTRGAWIGVGVGLMVFLYYRMRWALILVPIVALAMFIAVPSVRTRFQGTTSGPCESATYCKSSVLWREKQWQAAIAIASPTKVLTVGSGLGTVEALLTQPTHNEYLRLLIESGIFGLVAVLVLYKQLFGQTLKALRGAGNAFERDLALAFLAILVARVVIAATDNLVIVVLEWYFWSLAAIIVGIAQGVDAEAAETAGDPSMVLPGVVEQRTLPPRRRASAEGSA